MCMPNDTKSWITQPTCKNPQRQAPYCCLWNVFFSSGWTDSWIHVIFHIMEESTGLLIASLCSLFIILPLSLSTLNVLCMLYPSFTPPRHPSLLPLPSFSSFPCHLQAHSLPSQLSSRAPLLFYILSAFPSSSCLMYINVFFFFFSLYSQGFGWMDGWLCRYGGGMLL